MTLTQSALIEAWLIDFARLAPRCVNAKTNDKYVAIEQKVTSALWGNGDEDRSDKTEETNEGRASDFPRVKCETETQQESIWGHHAHEACSIDPW